MKAERPDGLFDMRTRAGREAEILGELRITSKLPQSWLDAIPQRRAAYLRLVAQGRVAQARPSIRERLRPWLERLKVWAVGVCHE